MIKKTFDQGWGAQWGWKQLENRVVNTMLDRVAKDNSETVVINSVWYTSERHEETMAWLRENTWDRIVLVAMLDASIPKPDWYAEFGREVIGLGYYPGNNELDLCALFVEEFLDLTPYGDLSDTSMIDTPFMCLNRKPHWHRKKFYQSLEFLNLLDRGMVSMGSEDGNAVRTLPNDCEPDLIAPNSETQHYGIPNSVSSLGNADNWRRCFLNVVTETMYDINRTNFVSEKIYKPIVGRRPFLVFDPDGAVKWLTDRGFESYVNDFKDISDLDLTRPEMVSQFLVSLCDQPQSYWQSKLVALQPKIMHNSNNFQRYVAGQKQRVQQGIQCQI